MKWWKNLLLAIVIGIIISLLTGVFRTLCIEPDYSPCPPNTLCTSIVPHGTCGFPVTFNRVSLLVGNGPFELSDIIWSNFILNSVIWIIAAFVIIWLISYLVKRKSSLS